MNKCPKCGYELSQFIEPPDYELNLAKKIVEASSTLSTSLMSPPANYETARSLRRYQDVYAEMIAEELRVFKRSIIGDLKKK